MSIFVWPTEMKLSMEHHKTGKTSIYRLSTRNLWYSTYWPIMIFWSTVVEKMASLPRRYQGFGD